MSIAAIGQWADKIEITSNFKKTQKNGFFCPIFEVFFILSAWLQYLTLKPNCIKFVKLWDHLQVMICLNSEMEKFLCKWLLIFVREFPNFSLNSKQDYYAYYQLIINWRWRLSNYQALWFIFEMFCFFLKKNVTSFNTLSLIQIASQRTHRPDIKNNLACYLHKDW